MSNLIAAVVLTVCIPASDHCEIDVPHVWRGPTTQDLHSCAQHAETLVLRGEDARCEVAYSHPMPESVEDYPIRDLANRAEVEAFLASLRR